MPTERADLDLNARTWKLSAKIKCAYSRGMDVSVFLEELESISREAWIVEDDRAVARALWCMHGVPTRSAADNVAPFMVSRFVALVEHAPSVDALSEYMAFYFSRMKVAPTRLPYPDDVLFIGKEVFSGRLRMDTVPLAFKLSTMNLGFSFFEMASRENVEDYIRTSHNVLTEVGERSPSERALMDALPYLGLEDLHKVYDKVVSLPSIRQDAEKKVNIFFVTPTPTEREKFFHNLYPAARTPNDDVDGAKARAVKMFAVLGSVTATKVLNELNGVRADREAVERLVEAFATAGMDERAFLEWIAEDGNELSKLVNDNGEPIVELWSALIPVRSAR